MWDTSFIHPFTCQKNILTIKYSKRLPAQTKTSLWRRLSSPLYCLAIPRRIFHRHISQSLFHRCGSPTLPPTRCHETNVKEDLASRSLKEEASDLRESGSPSQRDLGQNRRRGYPGRRRSDGDEIVILTSSLPSWIATYSRWVPNLDGGGEEEKKKRRLCCKSKLIWLYCREKKVVSEMEKKMTYGGAEARQWWQSCWWWKVEVWLVALRV